MPHLQPPERKPQLVGGVRAGKRGALRGMRGQLGLLPAAAAALMDVSPPASLQLQQAARGPHMRTLFLPQQRLSLTPRFPCPASSQVRQHVAHKRTFFFLEQLILKHGADEACVNVKEMHEVRAGKGGLGWVVCLLWTGRGQEDSRDPWVAMPTSHQRYVQQRYVLIAPALCVSSHVPRAWTFTLPTARTPSSLSTSCRPWYPFDTGAEAVMGCARYGHALGGLGCSACCCVVRPLGL